jgi:uncharacterized membrane protein
VRRDYPPPPLPEPHWPAQLTVALAIVLQLMLPDRLHVGPRVLLPALEAAMLIGLVIASPQRVGPNQTRRWVAIALSALVSVANAISLGLLTHYLLHHNVSNGQSLIVAGSLIWITNVLVFALWYWELDRGGPGLRALGQDQAPDLLFPQMSDDRIEPAHWRPLFLDYLYVALTNATAFSPTDTMPLSRAAKSIFGLQSLVSLVTIGLVVSRAVNIL